MSTSMALLPCPACLPTYPGYLVNDRSSSRQVRLLLCDESYQRSNPWNPHPPVVVPATCPPTARLTPIPSRNGTAGQSSTGSLPPKFPPSSSEGPGVKPETAGICGCVEGGMLASKSFIPLERAGRIRCCSWCCRSIRGGTCSELDPSRLLVVGLTLLSMDTAIGPIAGLLGMMTDSPPVCSPIKSECKTLLHGNEDLQKQFDSLFPNAEVFKGSHRLVAQDN
ncbi:hypothetical protein BJ170DRAFT_3135 [Xylariales sp. AK1849]|nr:hypothetical protein BJ170DRAFT_3135 [Xylariales sp. AK1849]